MAKVNAKIVKKSTYTLKLNAREFQLILAALDFPDWQAQGEKLENELSALHEALAPYGGVYPALSTATDVFTSNTTSF